MDRTTSIAVFQSNKAPYRRSDALLIPRNSPLEIKKLWIDGNKIIKHNLEKMEKRAKTIQMPANLE